MFVLDKDEDTLNEDKGEFSNESLLILLNWTRKFKNTPTEIYELIVKYYGNDYLFFLISNQGIFGWKLNNHNNHRLTLNCESNDNKRYKYYRYNNCMYRYGGNNHCTIDISNIELNDTKCILKWKVLHEIDKFKQCNWNGGKFCVLNNEILLLIGGQHEYNNQFGFHCAVNSNITSININNNNMKDYAYAPDGFWSIHSVQQLNKKCVFINESNTKIALYYPYSNKLVKLAAMNEDISNKISWYAPYHIENNNEIYSGSRNNLVYYNGEKMKWFNKKDSHFDHKYADQHTFEWFNNNPNTLLSVIINNEHGDWELDGGDLLISKQNVYGYTKNNNNNNNENNIFNVDVALKTEVYDTRCDEWFKMDDISINLGPIEWKENLGTDPDYDPFWNSEPEKYYDDKCVISEVICELWSF